jgi:hypothetical protein
MRSVKGTPQDLRSFQRLPRLAGATQQQLRVPSIRIVEQPLVAVERRDHGGGDRLEGASTHNVIEVCQHAAPSESFMWASSTSYSTNEVPETRGIHLVR